MKGRERMAKNCAVILAAGEGKRMKSQKPKALAEVLFMPMIDWVVGSARESKIEDICVVTGHLGSVLRGYLDEGIATVEQTQRLGTGHAVAQAKDFIQKFEGGNVLVLNGDAPFLDSKTISAALKQHISQHSSATVVTARIENPFGYGRIIRAQNGSLLKIVEQRDATPEEAAVCEVNSGAYWFNAVDLLQSLKKLEYAGQGKAEIYLTDVIEILLGMGRGAGAYISENPEVILGANDRAQLAELNAIARRNVLNRLMAQGVSIPFADGIVISPEVSVGADTVILPGTIIKGKTVIGSGCSIGPNTVLENCTVGDNVTINSSQCEAAEVSGGCSIGPFSRLRPGTKLKENVHIGNFVEVKNSDIGTGTSLSHLTYIGDSDIGSGVNIGCGCATANFDGNLKHRTRVGDNSFLGCDTCLVAPVSLGDNCYTAAGSVITQDVPDGALAVARERQTVKKNWAKDKKAYRNIK